jgi:Cu/Ag efflux protein CusF
MKQLRRSMLAVAGALLLALFCFGQSSSGKKQYTFHGKVESIDKGAKSMKVDGEKVEGWMNAMTMDFKVDNPSVLSQVKPGDRIMATVYDGDYTLHDVKVMGAAPKK